MLIHIVHLEKHLAPNKLIKVLAMIIPSWRSHLEVSLPVTPIAILDGQSFLQELEANFPCFKIL